MIDLPFDPNLVLGPLNLTWHALFGFLGIVGGAAVGIALIRPRVSFSDAYGFALGGVLGGLIGARLFHVIDFWGSTYQYRPLGALEVWNGGASIIGGIVGGLGVPVVMALRRPDLPRGWGFERGPIGLPVGMAIGRIGDIINGEHWATACRGLVWCVRYTAPNSPGQRDYVHPAVAYELLCDVAIVAILIALLPWADQRRHPQLPFVFLGLYGVARLSLSAFRLDPIFGFGMSQAQLASIAFVALAVVALAWLRRAGPSMAT